MREEIEKKKVRQLPVELYFRLSLDLKSAAPLVLVTQSTLTGCTVTD